MAINAKLVSDVLERRAKNLMKVRDLLPKSLFPSHFQDSDSDITVEVWAERTLFVYGQVMPVVAGNKSSKWRACERKATRLEYCLRDNNYRPIDCAPEILDLKECCQVYEVSVFLLMAIY